MILFKTTSIAVQPGSVLSSPTQVASKEDKYTGLSFRVKLTVYDEGDGACLRCLRDVGGLFSGESELVLIGRPGVVRGLDPLNLDFLAVKISSAPTLVNVVLSATPLPHEELDFYNGPTPASLLDQIPGFGHMLICLPPLGRTINAECGQAFSPPHYLTVTLRSGAREVWTYGGEVLGAGSEGMAFLYLNPQGEKRVVKAPVDILEATVVGQTHGEGTLLDNHELGLSAFSRVQEVATPIGESIAFQKNNRTDELVRVRLECQHYMHGEDLVDVFKGGMAFPKWAAFAQSFMDISLRYFMGKKQWGNQDIHSGNLKMTENGVVSVLDVTKMTRLDQDAGLVTSERRVLPSHVPPEVQTLLDKKGHDLWCVGLVLLEGVLGESLVRFDSPLPDGTDSKRNSGNLLTLLRVSHAGISEEKYSELSRYRHQDFERQWRHVVGSLLVEHSAKVDQFFSFLQEIMKIIPRTNPIPLSETDLHVMSEVIRLFLCPLAERKANYEQFSEENSELSQRLNQLLASAMSPVASLPGSNHASEPQSLRTSVVPTPATTPLTSRVSLVLPSPTRSLPSLTVPSVGGSPLSGIPEANVVWPETGSDQWIVSAV